MRLTQTVQKGGCAAKVEAKELRKILDKVRFPAAHPELLIDGRHFDDAAIYKVSANQALVQTLDFFTPIVDTPRLFGRVASCNALSDVYAMGGRPVTALGILAFPLATMDGEVITEVLQGASEMISEAKACFVGGHSIDDDTLKFGLSVTGFVHPEKVWSNQGAKAGDRLILTKPLGTGSVTAALKRSAVNEDDIAPVIQSMCRLNNVMDFLVTKQLDGIHAATDITGFGLSGHSYQLSRASEVQLHFEFDKIPVFEQAKTFLTEGFLTKAHRTNREYTLDNLEIPDFKDWRAQIIHDPQTSGGLLLSVQADIAEALVKSLAPHFPGVAIVGEVKAGPAKVNVV